MIDAVIEEDSWKIGYEGSVARMGLGWYVDVDTVRCADCETMPLSTVVNVVEVDNDCITLVDQYSVGIENIMRQLVQGVVEGKNVREDIDLPCLWCLILGNGTGSETNRRPCNNRYENNN